MQVLRLWMFIVCFERRGDCSLFLRVVALEMDEMGKGREVFGCNVGMYMYFRWMVDGG